jgi:hypothetical protein
MRQDALGDQALEHIKILSKAAPKVAKKAAKGAKKAAKKKLF